MIEELNKHQFEIMDVLANKSMARISIAMLPADDDSTEKFNDITKELDQVKTLMRLNLVEDVSGKFKAVREQLSNQYKRDFLIVAITETGQAMFEDHGRRLVN